jgi:hypothetical protein
MTNPPFTFAAIEANQVPLEIKNLRSFNTGLAKFNLDSAKPWH